MRLDLLPLLGSIMGGECRMIEYLKRIKRRIINPQGDLLLRLLARETQGMQSLLDLGCGDNSIVGSLRNVQYKVGVDVHVPSIAKSKSRKIHNDYVVMDLRNLHFPDRSFDVVVALDVVEHFDKEASEAFVQKMENISGKIVVVFTPNGFVDTSSPDILGRYDNNPWRIHLCGWTVDEFEARNYKCYGFNGIKYLRTGDCQIRFRPRFVWELIAKYSELLVYYFPSLAFQIIAVKRRTEQL